MAFPRLKIPPIQTKYKLIGLASIVAVLFTGYYDHFYSPYAKKIAQVQTELDSLQDTIHIITNVEYKEIKSHQDIIKIITTKMEDTKKKIDIEEKKLPDKSELSSMLKKITSMADDTAIVIKSLEPSPLRTIKSCNGMLLKLNINAQFINFFNFLERLKELPVYPESIRIDVKARPDLSIQFNLLVLAK